MFKLESQNICLVLFQVKEKESTKKKLQPCPFCEKKVTGFGGLEKGSGAMTCTSCKGTGIDAAMGKGTFLVLTYRRSKTPIEKLNYDRHLLRLQWQGVRQLRCLPRHWPSGQVELSPPVHNILHAANSEQNARAGSAAAALTSTASGPAGRRRCTTISVRVSERISNRNSELCPPPYLRAASQAAAEPIRAPASPAGHCLEYLHRGRRRRLSRWMRTGLTRGGRPCSPHYDVLLSSCLSLAVPPAPVCLSLVCLFVSPPFSVFSLRQAMDPLSPQYAPYILELDGGEKYIWCQV
jgi:hypothetical protein